LEAKSIYDERMVTREEYIVLWDKNIEFDNFSDTEIAQSMNEIIEGKTAELKDEVRRARESFGQNKSRKLGDIFRAAGAEYSLDKVRLLSKLFDNMIRASLTSTDVVDRPIINVLKRVISLAHENGCQVSRWQREYLASKGLFGELLADSEEGDADS